MEPAEQTVLGIARGYQLSQALVLAHLGGRERTEAEFTRLLDQAGLRLARTTALTAGPHVLEATP